MKILFFYISFLTLILAVISCQNDESKTSQEKIIKNAFLLANSLAGNNIAVAGPYPDKSFKAQLRLADSAGSKYTLILGENEINSGSVTLKDMAGKTQETVKQEDIINRLKSGV